jgi:hypothetical protein
MIDRNGKTVIPFAPGSKDHARADSDQVDESGKAIVALLKEAADTARATCVQAVDAAQKAAIQLRAAEARPCGRIWPSVRGGGIPKSLFL